MNPPGVGVDGTILRVLTGSRAYGLETPQSDYDYHGVYVTPTSELLAIGPNAPKSRSWNETAEQDSIEWEVGHFLFQATKCNPTMLETFVAPVEYATPAGYQLRVLFESVISRQRLYSAFLGYAHNQQKKMFSKPGSPAEAQPSERAWKFAVQYLRVLLQGERLLRTGEFVLNMGKYDDFTGRDFLMSVRRGKYTMGYVIDVADGLKRKLELAYTESKVCEKPDFEKVNDFLIDLRREVW